jgi:integrase
MARTVRDTNLETRSARLRLAPRRKPYWRVLETGLHLGYRRTKEGGGSWVARRFIGEGRYSETKIGTADDLQDADGVALHSFGQAQEEARKWWRGEQRRALGHAPAENGSLTVAKIVEPYFFERERRGSKGLSQDRSAAAARILPALGEIELSKLTTRRIRDWHAELARTPKLARVGGTTKRAKSRDLDLNDGDAMRARRATANRTLTVLKAALGHAFREGHIANDDPWRKVKPFRAVDAAVVRFLSGDECRRLANASQGAFRHLVRAALLTGCRYGELTRMRVGDFNFEAGTATIQESKAGKSRHVALTDEGRRLFSELAAGKTSREPIFVRDDGRLGGASHQQRPIDAASAHANLEPPATFHVLRHTYASALAMRGVPLGVIAAQLGHADTRMTERHYAHLAPNYVADSVRAALPTLDIVEESNVMSWARNSNG